MNYDDNPASQMGSAGRLCEVVITAPDPDWLATFLRQLINDRLCSSGHIIQQVRSLYMWQDEVHDTTEARASCRTRLELVPQIIDRVRQQHPYEVPSVVALPIVETSPEYASWLRQQTSRQTGD